MGKGGVRRDWWSLKEKRTVYEGEVGEEKPACLV